MKQLQITPNGCRWCGLPLIQPAHGRQWHPSVGLHAWEQPTQDQIKARMLARPAARQS